MLLLLLIAVFAAAAHAHHERVKIGSRAPDFSAQAVLGGEFQEVSLESLTKGGKWLLLMTYPADFT